MPNVPSIRDYLSYPSTHIYKPELNTPSRKRPLKAATPLLAVVVQESWTCFKAKKEP